MISLGRENIEGGEARRTFKPNLDVSEAILIRDIVHQDGSKCTAIIQWRHGPESLLTRRVPDLQPNLARIDDELFGEEAGANGGGQRVGEVTRGVAVHDGGLADALTADCEEWKGRGVSLPEQRRAAPDLCKQRTNDDLGFQLIRHVSAVPVGC